jgi:2-polyprenyl-6-methoxyphenol hydroxylase-like FAD-dependent oxidoreductase
VGADGLGSRVARSVDAPLTVERAAPGTAQYAYVRGQWSALEQHLGEAGFAGVFPTHGGEACIWVCAPVGTVREHRLRRPTDAAFLALLGEIAPTLAERVRAGEQTSPVRGMLRMPNQFRQATGPGWALVGDAGYHRDAITALGISDALRDAELLATALDEALRDPAREASALTAYGRDRDQMAAELFDLTVQLAAFPPRDRFVDLQKQLSRAIDDQAAALAALPSRVAVPVA